MMEHKHEARAIGINHKPAAARSKRKRNQHSQKSQSHQHTPPEVRSQQAVDTNFACCATQDEHHDIVLNGAAPEIKDHLPKLSMKRMTKNRGNFLHSKNTSSNTKHEHDEVLPMIISMIPAAVRDIMRADRQCFA